MKSFAVRLRQARLAAGLTQEQLGFEVNVTKASISAWENGRETPSFKTLSALSKALGQSLDALVLGDGWPEETIAQPSVDSAGIRNPQEQSLLLCYRRMNKRQRQVLLDLAILLGQKSE